MLDSSSNFQACRGLVGERHTLNGEASLSTSQQQHLFSLTNIDSLKLITQESSCGTPDGNVRLRSTWEDWLLAKGIGLVPSFEMLTLEGCRALCRDRGLDPSPNNKSILMGRLLEHHARTQVNGTSTAPSPQQPLPPKAIHERSQTQPGELAREPRVSAGVRPSPRTSSSGSKAQSSSSGKRAQPQVVASPDTAEESLITTSKLPVSRLELLDERLIAPTTSAGLHRTAAAARAFEGAGTLDASAAPLEHGSIRRLHRVSGTAALEQASSFAARASASASPLERVDTRTLPRVSLKAVETLSRAQLWELASAQRVEPRERCHGKLPRCKAALLHGFGPWVPVGATADAHRVRLWWPYLRGPCLWCLLVPLSVVPLSALVFGALEYPCLWCP